MSIVLNPDVWALRMRRSHPSTPPPPPPPPGPKTEG